LSYASFNDCSPAAKHIRETDPVTAGCKLTKQSTTLSLFPLHTVLFPGSILQLKIFEQRYLDLVKSCMKDSHGFIVTLINSGKEVNDLPTIYCVGTYVDIIDWEQLDDGLLGITIQAKHKVLIRNTRAQHDGLLKGDIEPITESDDTSGKVIKKYSHLKDMLEDLAKHPFLNASYSDIDYRSPVEVSYRLSEFLPASNQCKQELLETTNVEDRLTRIDNIIDQLQNK